MRSEISLWQRLRRDAGICVDRLVSWRHIFGSEITGSKFTGSDVTVAAEAYRCTVVASARRDVTARRAPASFWRRRDVTRVTWCVAKQQRAISYRLRVSTQFADDASCNDLWKRQLASLAIGLLFLYHYGSSVLSILHTFTKYFFIPARGRTGRWVHSVLNVSVRPSIPFIRLLQSL